MYPSLPFKTPVVVTVSAPTALAIPKSEILATPSRPTSTLLGETSR
jgi:hypothetical protein